MASSSLIVDLSISAEEFQRMYSGSARYVLGRARDGRTVRFPVKILQRFVQHDGVHGRFRISFDRDHKLRQIERL